MPVISAVGPGGLPALRLEAPGAHALVVLQGAHLWQCVCSGRALLATSPNSLAAPGSPLRGGIPVCWPWLGNHRAFPAGPLHGWVRTRPWQVVEAGDERDAVAVHLRLTGAEDGAPHRDAVAPASLDLFLRVNARGMDQRLVVTPTTAAPVRCSPALHAYLAVADASRVVVQGLDGLPWHGPGEENVLLPGAPLPACGPTEVTRTVHGDAPLLVRVDDLRVVSSTGAVVLWNPGAQRSAAIPDLGADAWRSFLCVEPAAVDRRALHIAPGTTGEVGLQIGIDAAPSPQP
jgi:glucose-6-phosphate 1-epimerase